MDANANKSLALLVSDLLVEGKRDEAMQTAYDALNVETSDAEGRATEVAGLLVGLLRLAHMELVGFGDVLAHFLSAEAEFQTLCEGSSETGELLRELAPQSWPESEEEIQPPKKHHPFKLLVPPPDEGDPE